MSQYEGSAWTDCALVHSTRRICFEICNRSRRDIACAKFIFRPGELMVTSENQPFEANLKAIAHCLENLSVVDESI